MTTRALLAFSLLAATLGLATSPARAFPTGVCPDVQGKLDTTGFITGTASDCTVDLTITNATPGSSVTVDLVPGNSSAGIAYEGSEDVLVGVTDNAPAGSPPVSAIKIQGVGLFAFDGDGISIFYTAANGLAGTPTGPNGYEGPNNSFSITDADNGYAVFTTPLNVGDTTYFSLEYPPGTVITATVVTPPGGGGGQTGVPEPASLALLGAALLGLGAVRRRR